MNRIKIVPMLRLNFSDLLQRDFQWRTYVCVCVCSCMYVYMYVHTRAWISHKLMSYLELDQTMTDVSVGITLPTSAEKKVHLQSYYYYDASFTKLSSRSSATSRRAYSTKPSFQSVLQGLQCNQCNNSGWIAGLSSKPEPEMETAKLSVEFSMYIFLVAEI
jgi:hypothetical protein